MKLKKRFIQDDLKLQDSLTCQMDDKGNISCHPEPLLKDMKSHWDKVFVDNPEQKLGWFESNPQPTLRLIEKAALPKDARILIIGAGSTFLVDKLIELGYTGILVTDISDVAINQLSSRLGDQAGSVKLIIDDVTNPSVINELDPVDLWVDRAVLHFFSEKRDQDTYFALLKSKVRKGGFVLLAEYNLQGAKICAGLPVHRYSEKMLQDKLESNFTLTDSFDYLFTSPSGDVKPYIYTLFQNLTGD